MSIDFSSGLCSDELAQQNIASMPPMSPNQNIKTDKGAGKSTIAVDARSPMPSRRSQPGSGSHWLQSPFQNLEAFAGMSPASNMSMSSFCFSSPGRFSPGRPPYTGTATPGINYRMSPETPLTSAMTKELVDELASPLFSPVLFSPYDASMSRHGQRKASGNSKLSLVQDFHDLKHADSPHPDIFTSLSSTGMMSGGKYSGGMDAFPPGFTSYRKAFPELIIPEPAPGEADGHSDTTAEASAGSTDAEKVAGRPGSLSTDSVESSDSVVALVVEVNGTPLARQNPAIPGSAITAKASSAEHRASFFSPAISAKKNLPHNISPALSESSTPSHCNCKKSKCLKLYCECFAALRYCNSCKCVDCNNRAETEQARQVAIQVTKDRNAGAFESKVSTVQGHSTGCNCKKSQCLKKYCECFEGDAFCGDNCKCISCQNFSGSVQLEVSRNLKHRKSSSAAGKRNNVPAQASTFVVPVPVAVPPTSTVALPKKYMSNSRSAAARGGLEPAAKRQKLVQESDEPVYPFFGNELPSAPKSIALRCLEFLNGKDIYSTSLLNQLWCKAAMDNALWEADE